MAEEEETQKPEQQAQQPSQGLQMTPSNVFAVGTRDRARKEQLVEYLGELLIPVTEGFEHINLDMSFTYLGMWDLFRVDNLSEGINICHMYGLKQSEFLFRGDLAVLLNSRRSRNARTMALFTDVTTHQTQTFKDETEEKKGFSFLNFGKKKSS